MDKVQEVRDGDRNLVFHGESIAFSTSLNTRSKGRWIEFELFRTDAGAYVLSRTGQTRFVHAVDCHIAERNGLDVYGIDEVGSLDGLYTCPECTINLQADDEFCPELPRYWAMRFYTAEDVVQALHKRDDRGNMYLTNVARDLLAEAAEVDQGIEGAYYSQII